MKGCVNEQPGLFESLVEIQSRVTGDPCLMASRENAGHLGQPIRRPRRGLRPSHGPAPRERTVTESRDHYVWVTELQGRVVGMVDLVRDGPHVARIRRLRVDPAWQHTAVLTKLIQRVHDYCWDHGCMKLVLDAGGTPRWVVGLLERLGCQVIQRDGAIAKNMLELYLDLYHCHTLHEDGGASREPAA